MRIRRRAFTKASVGLGTGAALTAFGLGCTRSTSGADVDPVGAAGQPSPAHEPDTAAAPAGRTVLVELFTSEGCSSCPPADELLAELEASQPIDDVRIVGLEAHVDYWNDLGWRDPFSSAAFSRRQRTYAKRAGTGRVYTPEAIVDGAGSYLGSSRSQLVSAIEDAASRPTVDVAIERADSRLEVEVGSLEVAAGQPATLMVAIVEAGLTTKVEAGENAGRTLSHASVLRRLHRAGPADAGVRSVELDLDSGWNVAELSAVAFVQLTGSLRIVGSSVLALG